MTTNIDLGCDNDMQAQAQASRRGQSPGFRRIRIGQPLITALYDGTRRLLCPHVLGYNRPGDWRVFCYQYGGETKGGPLPVSGEGIWRCLALGKLSSVEWVTGPWRTELHAAQRCVEHIEVDADDYPGGDPQHGQ